MGTPAENLAPKLAEVLPSLERTRRLGLLLGGTLFLLGLALGFWGARWLWREGELLLAFFALILGAGLGLLGYFAALSPFTLGFKRQVVGALAKALGLEYRPEDYLPQDEFQASFLFHQTTDYTGEDLFTGPGIVFSEIRAEQVWGGGRRRESLPVFKGLFLRAEGPWDEEVYLVPGAPHPELVQRLGPPPYRIRANLLAQEGPWQVYGTGEHPPVWLPQVAEVLRRRFPQNPPYVAFHPGRLYVALPAEDRFEPNEFRRLDLPSLPALLETLGKDLQDLLACVNELRSLAKGRRLSNT
mgnify:CR=1 FL=1